MRRYGYAELRSLCVETFCRGGVPAADAELMAEVLLLADMRGIASHGVVRSARYLDCIQAGGIRPDREPEVLAEGEGFCRMSAAGGLGIPASCKAIRRLLELGRQRAMAVVTVNHSDHFGAAGTYAQWCSEAGLIGFAMSNTCPLIAVTGAAARTIGNNPFAYAAPGQRHRGILFDICMSVVAAGKIDLARVAGEKIPLGWILDGAGRPSDDPALILTDAAMLPVGGHKGYGFAVMVEVLAAVLGCAGVLSEVKSWNCEPGRDANTGHCFFTFNPEYFGGLAAFRARMDAMIEEMTSAPKAPGVERIYYPGELEFIREAEARQLGVPLGAASSAQLLRAAALTGVRSPFLAELAAAE